MVSADQCSLLMAQRLVRLTSGSLSRSDRPSCEGSNDSGGKRFWQIPVPVFLVAWVKMLWMAADVLPIERGCVGAGRCELCAQHSIRRRTVCRGG